MNMKILFGIVLVLGILVSGCTQEVQNTYESPPELGQTSEQKATNLCVAKCKEMLNASEDLSSGPCLLDPIPDIPKWVCDVAHNPREEIDNKPENQCSSYRGNLAEYFVEVSPDCELIRSG